jgi:peptidyl-dipeptidase Dcp
LNELLEKAKPFALKEFKELEKFAKTIDQIDYLEKWDSAYYSEKLKRKLFNLDDEKLKPYFKLENVIEGAFTVAKKLFGLNFKQINTIDTYHEDVKTYNVTDHNDNFVALFYGDFHPRKGKRHGAWMTSFKGQKN